MGDFLLDLRGSEERALARAGGFLKFYPDMQVDRFEYPEFGLVVSGADDPRLWGPHAAPDGSVLSILCGRIALDQRQWDEAARVEGSGGLACKYISRLYARQGAAGIESLSGNFVVILYDRPMRTLWLITDRWGLVPAFKFDVGGGRRVFASHPDALADAVGETRNWDLTSFAEFILTGKLSAPFTYYRNIQALPVASATALAFGKDGEVSERVRTYFQFLPHPQSDEREEELAERFAEAFRGAVARRTLPVLGRSAVALSGGLDSRTVLCSAPDRRKLVAFTCYDTENREFRIARSIAREANVEFIPLRRGPDYYGENAELGVRISAGMGCIASNHFSGFRDQFRQFGFDNLLTGCYCDYLFKGLALNKQVNPLTTRERLGGFDFSYYFGHFSAETDLAAAVRERLEGIFPAELRGYDSPATVLAVERRRMFPLCYEEDNAERTIPQRVMGWYVPIADNDLMEVILQMSCSMKLNRRLFASMVEKVCGPDVSRIPDANTGAPINASVFRVALRSHMGRVEALYRRLVPSTSTAGSWLDWGSYARQSPLIQSLWSEPTSEAREVFGRVLGKEGFKLDVGAYEGRRIGVFLQLFTLKLWFDQRS